MFHARHSFCVLSAAREIARGLTPDAATLAASGAADMASLDTLSDAILWEIVLPRLARYASAARAVRAAEIAVDRVERALLGDTATGEDRPRAVNARDAADLALLLVDLSLADPTVLSAQVAAWRADPDVADLLADRAAVIGALHAADLPGLPATADWTPAMRAICARRAQIAPPSTSTSTSTSTDYDAAAANAAEYARLRDKILKLAPRGKPQEIARLQRRATEAWERTLEAVLRRLPVPLPPAHYRADAVHHVGPRGGPTARPVTSAEGRERRETAPKIVAVRRGGRACLTVAPPPPPPPPWTGARLERGSLPGDAPGIRAR